MLKEDLNIKELLESIEHEMEMWSGYYSGNTEITNMKIKEILGIKKDISQEELQKKVNKCKDTEKINKMQDIINTGNLAYLEAQISLRTLTWVRNLMTEEQNTKEDE